MDVIVLDDIVAQSDIIALLIGLGIPLVGASIVVLGVGYAYSRYFVQKQIEAAEARVLREYPEFTQTKEDFRVFARKVSRELGWNEVTFSFN